MSCNSYSSYSLYNSNKNVNQQICCLKQQIVDLSNIVTDLSNIFIQNTNPLSIIESSDISFTLPQEPIYTNLPLANIIVNQNNFVVLNNQITIDNIVQNRFLEIYVNLYIHLDAANSRTFKVDISGVNNSILKTIDIRSISRTGNNNISFGAITLYPSEINFNDTFVIRATNNGNNNYVIKSVVTIKTYSQ